MPRTSHGLPGIYNASGLTLTDGEGASHQLDVNGNVKTTLGTAIAGEDLTNDVLKVEQRFSYANVTLAAPTTTTIKSGVGVLHAIVFNKPASTGTVTLYDNTTNSGAIIGTITSGDALPRFLVYDCAFTVGLTLVTATAAQDITVIYR